MGEPKMNFDYREHKPDEVPAKTVSNATDGKTVKTQEGEDLLAPDWFKDEPAVNTAEVSSEVTTSVEGQPAEVIEAEVAEQAPVAAVETSEQNGEKVAEVRDKLGQIGKRSFGMQRDEARMKEGLDEQNIRKELRAIHRKIMGFDLGPDNEWGVEKREDGKYYPVNSKQQEEKRQQEEKERPAREKEQKEKDEAMSMFEKQERRFAKNSVLSMLFRTSGYKSTEERHSNLIGIDDRNEADKRQKALGVTATGAILSASLWMGATAFSFPAVITTVAGYGALGLAGGAVVIPPLMYIMHKMKQSKLLDGFEKLYGKDSIRKFYRNHSFKDGIWGL